jgi:hypothetical protein
MRSLHNVKCHVLLITVSARFYLNTGWVLLRLVFVEFFVN